MPVADGMPEGWEIQPLSGVLTYVRGRSYASDDLADAGGTIMVNLKSLKAYGGYNWNTEKHFMGRVKQEQLLEPGDIVMGVTDMTQERRLIGYVAMVPGVSDRMTFSMDLIKLVPLTVEKSYLYALMLYGGYSERISRAANGVNVLHLKPETMMDMSVLVPSNRVMRMYDAFFKQCQEKAEALQKQCSIASEARDRLLSKLMSRGAEM